MSWRGADEDAWRWFDRLVGCTLAVSFTVFVLGLVALATLIWLAPS